MEELASKAKLIKVVHATKGKKMLKYTNFVEFSHQVKEKYRINDLHKICFQDTDGAEIEEDVFDIFILQEKIPTIYFMLENEIQSSAVVILVNDNHNKPSTLERVSPDSASSSSPCSSQNDNSDSNSSDSTNEKEKALKSVLLRKIEDDVYMKGVYKSYVDSSILSTQDSNILVNFSVGVLVNIKGPNPKPHDQKLLAKVLVDLLPILKYPLSEEGLDNLYDTNNRIGKIQCQLRKIHSKVNTSKKRDLKLKPEASPKRGRVCQTEGSSMVGAENSIEILHSLHCVKDRDRIFELMKNTLDIRNELRLISPERILSTYTKFLDSPGLIDIDFCYLFPSHDSNTFETEWSSWGKVLTAFCEKNLKSKQKKSAYSAIKENWNETIAALFCLLLLVPPTAQGKGRAARLSAVNAQNCLLVFHQNETPIDTIISNWPESSSQPCLLAKGNNRKSIQSFWIVYQKLAIPLGTSASAKAIDSLFKAYFVFRSDYNSNLKALFQFLQCYIYEIDSDSTEPTRQVKDIYTQLLSFRALSEQ